MKRRLCIFAFFNEKGIVDEQTVYLLTQLQTVAEYIWIVVNGILNEAGRVRLESFSKKIFIRENKGFDAGAYREVILGRVGNENMEMWDEVILCNNTFYGPFTPLIKIFTAMEDQNVDFWGFSKYDMPVFPHIISHFLVFREKIVHDGLLYRYFESIEKYSNTQDIRDVYAFFEVGIYDFMTRRGCRNGVYSDIGKINFYKSPFVCIRDHNLPILKRKFFSKEYYNVNEYHDLIAYLDEHTDYPVQYLEKMEDTEGNNCEESVAYISYPSISRQRIEEYLRCNSSVYIYGEGIFARRLWFVFKDDISDFKGFVVSDYKNKVGRVFDYPVYKLSETDRDSAIIVALNSHNSREVMKSLGGREVLYIS